ncbi:MAG: tRNA (guanosine(46)-N7)-methyltransferase TrmB [Ilumatobacteraceae bacterium]
MDGPSITHIRSFKPRRRRLGTEALEVWERLGPRYVHADEGGPLDLRSWFGPAGRSDAPRLVVEIGFGGGEALIDAASARPAEWFVGVEVHQPGLAQVLRAIDGVPLVNVHLVHGDALVLLDRLADASVDELRVFFPDPWPKVRHHKRRIVRPDVVATWCRVLRPGGLLRIATDWDDYAAGVDRVCGGRTELAGGRTTDRSDRSVTRFEQRALAEGREVVEFTFTRRRSG